MSTMGIISLQKIDTNGYCHYIGIGTNLEEFYLLKFRTVFGFRRGFGITLQKNSLLVTLI